MPLDARSLLKIGERLHNPGRYCNDIAVLRRGFDWLPRRFEQQPGTGYAQGSVCELHEMLKEYYALGRWENGVMTESELVELGITE